MPPERDTIIEKLRNEAIARCMKRIEDAAAGRQKGVNTKTYARQDFGLTMTLKRARGL